MSGTMQAPQQAPQAPRPQMPMQAPPPMPMAQGAGAPPPQMQPAPPPQQPQIVPPVVGGAAAQNPNLALFGQMAQGAPGGAPGGGQPKLTAAEMARLGRYGDKVIGHLTPGEIAVPPQVQSPKVLATLKQAFNKVGVSPAQFTAGSPVASQNPMTGAPEYSLWAALLPVLGAVVGSVIPGVGTAAGGALGGAAGGLAGGMIDHQGALGTILSGLGGAAGGYVGGSGGLGGLLGGGSSAAGAGAAGAAGTAGATGAATAATTAPFTGAAGAGLAGAMAADVPSAGAGAATTAGAGALGSAATNPAAMTLGQRLMMGMYAGTGASLGGSLAPAQDDSKKSTDPIGPPLPPLNTNYGALLGSGQANRPSFNGYNPFTATMGPNPGYRFFPVS